MISTLVLPYPATRGDSRIGWIVSRVSSAEAVVGGVNALVAVVARSRSAPGDRTLIRLLASLLALLLVPVWRAMGGVRGRVRPDDINGQNAVLSSRIADANIEYDGKGFASRGAKPGIVTQIFSWLGLL